MRPARRGPARRAVALLLPAGLVATSLLLAACQGGDASTTSAISSSDNVASTSPETGDNADESAGRVATITAADLPDLTALGQPGPETPQRIVSLATGVGETLVALGVGDRVVGRDETSEVPADAEVVTKAHNVSAERVISLAPDLVIVDARTTPPEALDAIEASGARIVEVPEAWTLADMAPRTQAIADAVGVDPSALLATLPPSTTSPGDTGATSGSTTSSGSASASANPDAPTVAFLYLRGTSAIYLLGGAGSGADALITAAGGIDVGAAAGLEAFTPLTAEELITLDPDVLLVMTKGMESVNGIDGLLALPGVAQTTAGRDGRVIAVDDEVLLSFGPRTGALVDLLRSALVTVTSS